MFIGASYTVRNGVVDYRIQTMSQYCSVATTRV
jgi:hypothetical protein